MKYVLVSVTLLFAQVSFAISDRLLTTYPLCVVDSNGYDTNWKYDFNTDGTGNYGPAWNIRIAWESEFTWYLVGDSLELTFPDHTETYELRVIRSSYPARIGLDNGGELYQCR